MKQKKENLDYVKENNSALSIELAMIIVIIVGLTLFGIYYTTRESSISFVFAVFMAMVSLFIALGANLNTRKMAQANLHGIVRDAFNSRYTFFKELHNLESMKNITVNERLNRGKQYKEFATWDMVLCLKQANILKVWASTENKNSLAHSLYILIDNVMQQKSKKILKNRHVEHLLIGCNLLIEIGVSKKFEKSIIDKFEEYSSTKKECTECFQNYVKRKLDEVNNDPTGQLKTQEYMEELFKGFK